MMFKDRKDAGQKLAILLSQYYEYPDAMVIGLARGGAVIAFEVAKKLHLPWSIMTPKKMGAPFNAELAIGAVSEFGNVWINENLKSYYAIENDYIQKAKVFLLKEAKDKRSRLLQGKSKIEFRGKTVILVDDGVATGATFLVEIEALKTLGAKTIIASCPVASIDSWDKIKREVDSAICPQVEEDFEAVGNYYLDFSEITDEQVSNLLEMPD